jgi:hypothetical protein
LHSQTIDLEDLAMAAFIVSSFGRQIRILGDGGYATKEYLHQFPARVDVVSRMLITGKLYELPPLRDVPRRRRARIPRTLGSDKRTKNQKW